jgi:hypothetical protein
MDPVEVPKSTRNEMAGMMSKTEFFFHPVQFKGSRELPLV